MNRIFHDIVRFVKSHWVHVLVAIPAVVGFTVLHELAHCAGVWIQGGRVIEFVWWPQGAEWGHMAYTFPNGMQYSQTVVSLTPYVCWVSLCLIAGLLSLKSRPWPFWAASTIFVWLFLVPLGDTANTAVPYMLWNSANDFQSGLGPVCAPIVAALIAVGVLLVCLGFVVQKRLYRQRSLDLAAYGTLVAAAGLAFLGLSIM